MAISALFVPAYVAGSRLIWGARFLGATFVVVLYASVLAALLSTFACYRSDQQSSFTKWRRKPYTTGVAVLLALCLLPLATWPIVLSGVTLHLRVAVRCLLVVNAAAACLVRERLVQARIDDCGLLGLLPVVIPSCVAGVVQ